MAIDYEVEYDNRARVPEHPRIMAEWARDAAVYRAEAERQGRAELGLTYGSSPRQMLDLFHPAHDGGGPLALFIHGGYWRAFDPSSFSHMARGLNGRGLAVALAGYDLCPQVTIADIIGEMREACLFLWRRSRRRLLVFGHSAGGHLTACMVATDWSAEGAPEDLVPAGLALSGLFDLVPLVATRMNADLRLTAESARAVSPLFWKVPPGRMLDARCGARESAEYRRQNRAIGAAWAPQGAIVTCDEVEGADHFTLIAPLVDPESAMVARLAVLAERTRALG